MASLALECLYEMSVYRRLIPPLVGGEVALFSLSSAVLAYFHRNKQVAELLIACDGYNPLLLQTLLSLLY